MAHAAGDALDIPIYGSHYRVTFPILDADGDLVTGASTPDSEVSIDCGTFADCTNEITEIATSSGMYYLDLTGAEMTGKIITVIIKTATAGAKTTSLSIHTTRMAIIATGTAQAGAAGTITLAAGTSKQDNDLAGLYVRCSNNSPAGVQYATRRIISNVTSTQVATVESNWGTNPSSATTYDLLAPASVNVTSFGGTMPTSIATAGIQDVNAKNINNVSTSSVTTINANIGQTQPVNFTGTGASALVKSDMVDIAGAAVSTSTAQVGVNVVNFGGSAGTFASGRPEVNTTHWKGGVIPAPAVTGTPRVDAEFLGGIGSNIDGIVTIEAQYRVNGYIACDAIRISGDATAADNLETAFDDTAGAVPWIGIIDQGTAQAATGTTLQLRAAAAFADDELNGAYVTITGGTTGVGQTRQIDDYVSATDTATVKAWTTTPTGTITYKVWRGALSDVNVTQISDDATAAANAESFFDGTGYAGTNNVIPTVTTVNGLAANVITAAATAADFSTEVNAAVLAVLPAALVGGRMDSSVGAMAANTITAAATAADYLAEINAEVVDCLNVDTYAEIGQESPAATNTIRKMLGYLFKAWRNRSTQTATAYKLYADDATTVDQKSTVSDDGTTFDSGEKATGP